VPNKEGSVRFFFVGFVAFIFAALSRTVSAAPYQGVLIDAHVHLSARSDPEKIRQLFDRNNVASGVFFPRQFRAGDDFGVSDQQESELPEKYRSLGLVLIGLQREYLKGRGNDKVPAWIDPGDEWRGFLLAVEGELSKKTRIGMGELIVRHYDYHGKGYGNNDFPIRSKVFQDLLSLANTYKVPLVFHAEGEPHVVSDLLSLLPEYPNGKYIWAHACGRSDASRVREWLKANRNLYCDLANMTDTGNYGSLWPMATPWTVQIERDGVLLTDWKNLLDTMPDRFIIGSDVNEAKGWNNAWERRIQRFRELLGQLNPSAASLIGEGNARRLFGIQ
jgi:hypothetical protein